MNLVMCPNGHPNRPGATQCTICRAPIALDVPEEVEADPPVAASAGDPEVTTSDKLAVDGDESSGGSSRNGCGWLIGLLIVGLIAAGAALIALFWPTSTETVSAPELDPVTAVAVVVETAAVATPAVEPATTVPTADPTAAPPTPTEIPPTVPPPTEPPPTEPPPTATPEPEPELEPTETPPTGNFLTNGDFSSRWVNDWTRQVAGVNGIQVVEQRTLPDDPDQQMLHLSKSGSGVVTVAQTVEIPSRATEIQFLGRVRLAGGETAAGEPGGRAALMLIYQNADGERIGQSVWMDPGGENSALWGQSPLPPYGPTTAPRFVDDDGWQTIDVRLQQEFVNRLPTVSPNDVSQITVMMVLIGSDECEPQACATVLEVADLQFLPVAME